MITEEKKQSTSEYAERRKSQRVPARFRIEFADGSDGSTVDISESGACLVSSNPVEIDKAEINIRLPFKPVGLKVNRVWSRQDVKTNEFFYGVKFFNPSDEDLFLIRENLAHPWIDETDQVEYKKIRKLYDRQSLDKKVDYLSKHVRRPLTHIRGCTYDTNYFKNNIENPLGVAQIPLGIAGPIKVNGKNAKGDFYVPMATTEGALLLTYDLGSRLLRMTGPVQVEIQSKVIHVDPMFPIKTNEDVLVSRFVDENFGEIKKVAEKDSSHTRLLSVEKKRVLNSYVLKFMYDTADAHGLNMINSATFNACNLIREKTGCSFYLRSHYSGVKHHSLLNETQGYGRLVKASAVISSKALGMLGVNAEVMKDFFDRCRQCGHAAGISAVNVHAANAIAAIFIACGQDAADIVSSGLCDTTVQLTNDKKDLTIEVVLRNLLVGTVGGGTGLGTQHECLEIMGCHGSGKSDKFAEIIAAIVLAGEFPTAAAVINETYVDIHNKYGRNKSKFVE